MDIHVTNQGDVYEIALSGWLDTETAPALGEKLAEIPDGVTELVLDLRELEYTSSAGVRQIVAAYKQMNGHMKLKNVCPEIMDVFKMTGLDKRLNIE